MIETTTYFEAYRPVLNALGTIGISQDFPLQPFILKLTKEHIPPSYVTPMTTYDFTPLLVEPKSKVRTVVTNDKVELNPFDPLLPQRFRQSILSKNIRINYQQSDLVPTKYKSVNLLDSNQWPTSDELHLNPKQHEALMLALTHKVALIQGRK